MVKRTLSDGELFAQSKNRHESNHLKLKLDEIKTQEIQSNEIIRLEKHKWREFLRTNSRNSGRSSALMNHDSEVVDAESSRNRCDPQTVEKYQRQWVVTYHNHSHNKVYKEIEQAGASVQRSLKSPRATVSVSGSSSPNGEVPSLSKHVTAVMGVKRVRNNWESKRPKTSGADYRHVEITDLKQNNEKPNSIAPWLRKDDQSVKLAQGIPTSKRDSYVDQINPSSPQELNSDKLFQSVTSIQAITRSRNAWRCSICGKEKVLEGLGDKFAHTVLVYKGLNKILNNLQSKSTSALQEDPEAISEVPKEKKASSRCSCHAKKTSITEKPDKRLSQTTSTLTYPPTQDGSLKSPRISTSSLQSQQSRRSSKSKNSFSGTGSSSDISSRVNDETKIKKASLSSSNHDKQPLHASTMFVDYVAALTVDIPTNEVNDNQVDYRDNGVSNTDIEPDNTEPNIRSNRSHLHDKDESNADDSNSNGLRESKQDDKTNEAETNLTNNVLLPSGLATNLNDNKNLDLKCNNTASKTPQSNASETILTKDILSNCMKSESSTENYQGYSFSKANKTTRINLETEVGKPEDTITIDLKAGELFFQRAAETIKAKLTERRSMETLIVSADKGHPRVRKHETLKSPNVDGKTQDNSGGLNKGNNNGVTQKTEINAEKSKNYVIMLEKRDKRSKNNETIVASNHPEHIHMASSPNQTNSSTRDVQVDNLLDQSAYVARNSATVTPHKDNLVDHFPDATTQNHVGDNTGLELFNDYSPGSASPMEMTLPSSARARSAREALRKQTVEFKGIIIKNYIPPQLRYKTAASDKLKRPLSVQWHPTSGAVVTVHEKSDKARLIDLVFPKQARQRQLLQMIENNHRKLPSTATFIADADLRRRIDIFLQSVEPFCRR
ncbi:hypothetical protein BgiBS90_026328 [Biomphalaria glabrata]|nr:hypothetical protein BgiBS90_026328 [Biomphalaria glabrata]